MSCAMSDDNGVLLTDDVVLSGKVRLRQPAKGHRAGTDAVIVAAAVLAEDHHKIVDFGAGVGSVGLMVAARVPMLELTSVEIDPELAALCEENVAANGVKGRVIAGDVIDRSLNRDWFDHVVMNPPFYPPGSQAPRDARTARARLAHEDLIPEWIIAARAALRTGGVLTAITRVDGLPQLLTALRGFGSTVVVPVHPFAELPASRVIVAAVKGSKGPLVLERPLILHDSSGDFSAETQALHQGGRLLRELPSVRRARTIRPSRHQPR